MVDDLLVLAGAILLAVGCMLFFPSSSAWVIAHVMWGPWTLPTSGWLWFWCVLSAFLLPFALSAVGPAAVIIGVSMISLVLYCDS